MGQVTTVTSSCSSPSVLAINAEALARRLRKKYKITPLGSDGEWDPLEVVRRVQQSVESRKERGSTFDGKVDV